MRTLPNGDMTRIEIQTGDIHTPPPSNRASVLVSFVTQKREFCITCVCSAYYKPVYAKESIHEPKFLPKRLSKLNHQSRFPRDYHSTYTFVKFLFILRHLASISPALPNLWLLLVIIVIIMLMFYSAHIKVYKVKIKVLRFW